MRSIFIAVIALLLSITGFNKIDSQAHAADIDSQPEYLLASLNAGRRVSSNDITIQRFRYLLSSIQKSSGEPPSRIADKVAKGRDLVRSHYGKEVSLLIFTEDANRAMQAAPRGTSFTDVVSLLIIATGAP